MKLFVDSNYLSPYAMTAFVALREKQIPLELVLVNLGGASGAEILALAREVQHAVRERFGVELEPEPTIL